jgi:chemotaxis protein MotB
MLISLALVSSLAGCTSVDKASWESKAAKEFASQKQGVCCFVGMKTLDDESQPKSNAGLIAKERERAGSATQLERAQPSAAKDDGQADLANQLASARADLAAKEQERAELAARLAALQTSLAGGGDERSDLARQLAELKNSLTARDRENADLAAQLAAKEKERADLAAQLVAPKTDLSAMEKERAESAAELAALKASLAEGSRASLTLSGEEKDTLARQFAATQADLAAKENERAELAQQLEALRTQSPKATVELKERELFDPGSAALKPMGIKVLEKLAESLKAQPDKMIRIEGHTDDRPIQTSRFPSNWHLSAARAIVVVSYLEKRGIPPERLIAVGYGASRPAVPNTDAESRAQNRRVEIFVMPAASTAAGNH